MYAYAHQGLTPAVGGFDTLQPSAGVIIRLAGEESVQWERPLTPAKGAVQLSSGANWIAWSGRDHWSVEDVAKGIGVSLQSIELGEHTYDPADPESVSGWPEVMRGDALKVTVARDVIWLQPTYVMPKLIFTGNVDQSIRNAVKRDLADMAAYVAGEFGVQADPFRLVIIIPGDVRSLFDELERQGRSEDLEGLRSWWQRSGGRGGPDININKAEFWNWSRGRYSYGRYVLLEEYYHAIQFQLVGSAGADWPPTWMVEGSINWIRGDVATQERTGYPLSRRLIDARNQASKGPPLEQTEQGNATWQYSFGLIAADLLIERADTSAFLDFFRALAPGRTGSKGQWESQLTWQDAFAATYGISVEEFYEEFETVMAKLRGSARRRPASNQVSLSGIVVDRDGSPRPGVRLTSYEIKNGSYVTFGSAQAKSNEDGEFTLFVRKRADHRIRVRLADLGECGYWWTSDGNQETWETDDVELIEVGASDPSRLTITVDPNRCRWRINGQLTGPDGEPLGGIQIQARADDVTLQVRTEADGTFEVVTTTPQSYTISANLGGCRTYWQATGATQRMEEAEPIQVIDADVTGLRFHVQDHTCPQISGRFLDAGGDGIGWARVSASSTDGSAGTRTGSDGSFSIALSSGGQYRVEAWHAGCRVMYRRGGATGSWREATQIHVADNDVFGIDIRLTQKMCRHRISGHILNADGTPRTGQWTNGSSSAGIGGDYTDSSGSFSFAVPGDGPYRLAVWVDGCTIYRGADGPTSEWQRAREVDVRNRDVSGIVFRLPEDPASFCSESE